MKGCKKRCLVQLRYKGEDSYLSVENTATVLEVASAYHNKVMDRLGKAELDEIWEKFGNIVLGYYRWE